MKLLFGMLLTLAIGGVHAQDSTHVTPEQRRAYRRNQHQLDMNHGGIGIRLYRPALGKITHYTAPWVDVAILSDILELQIGFGKVNVSGDIPYGFDGTQYVSSSQFGSHFYIGANVPLNVACFGKQETPLKVFRGHPTISGGFGVFSMTDSLKYTNRHTSQIWYFGITPGYRIRTPFGSVELNLNTRLGFSTGDQSDYFKGLGFYPSITFRVDALKWKYNPKLVSVEGTQTTVSDYKSTRTYNGTTYEGNTRVDHYTVHTSATVTVSPINIGVQDIGPHLGIGPKLSFMNPKRSPNIPSGNLIGAVLEGRGGPFDFGFCIEGGKIGHGGRLLSKDKEAGKYRKKLDKTETSGLGTLNTVNVYTQLGIDISTAFLIPLGIAIDKGEATSFFSITAGLNLGGHFSFNQQFLDPASNAVYDKRLVDDKGQAKAKFIDPRAAKSGFLGGFYIAAQVGALSFKITNYRYYGAPFASTTMMSIAYRFPLNAD